MTPTRMRIPCLNPLGRFPLAPAALTRRIRAIADPARLQGLIPAVITAPDLAAVEALLG